MDHAACSWTFKRLGNAMAAPGGFEIKALGALVHLRDAWCSADRRNRPNMAAAIALVLARCAHKELAHRVLAETLDAAELEKMLDDVAKYDLGGPQP